MAQVKFFKFDTDGFQVESDPTTDEVTLLGLTLQSGGNVNLSGGGEVLGLPASPSGDTASVSKAYVDSVASGLDVHPSVRAATTAVQNLASDFENGDVIDGVTLATGDRVLIKDQASGAENGIYEVQTSGAPVRVADLTTGDSAAGSFVFCEEGTVNADAGFVCTADAGTDVVGTDPLSWSQFSGAGQITAGTGLTKSGNTIDVGAGDGITVNVDDVAVNPDGTTGGNIQPVNVAANGVGFDVALIDGVGIEADGAGQLQLATQGNGITGGGGTVLSVLSDIVSTTTTEANAIDVGANGVNIKVDDSSIEGSLQGGAGAESLRVKAGGITGAMLDPDIDILTTGNIETTAGVFTGDGSGLTNLPVVGATETVTITALKSTAGTINKGQVVYIVGHSGIDHTVELAQSNAAGTMPAIGIVNTTVTDSVSGNVIIFGHQEGLNTSGFSASDDLYISPSVAGGLTNVKPTGAANLIQKIAEVAKVDAVDGHIVVTGVGRANALPNLTDSKLWLGDGSDVPQEADVGDGLSAVSGSSIDVALSALSGLELAGVSPNKTLQALVDGTTIQINGSGELEVLGGDTANIVQTNYTTDGTGVTKGDPVFVSANDIVTAANANNNNCRKYIGIAKATVGASAPVEIISAGKVDDVTIAGSPAAGDLVYLAVGGGLTAAIPTGSGNHRLVVGKVANDSGTPDIHIEPQYLGKIN